QIGCGRLPRLQYAETKHLALHDQQFLALFSGEAFIHRCRFRIHVGLIHSRASRSLRNSAIVAGNDSLFSRSRLRSRANSSQAPSVKANAIRASIVQPIVGHASITISTDQNATANQAATTPIAPTSTSFNNWSRAS